ncbi:hypothetical protein DPMN_092337 [Dreissena polymorpha]|uniref:Uncharacterized protein n=1 Tax=Dreissena polymorpha TaxID=45954 RepID=A0A9D4L233_DREPO|nr:hypothetical protein DPMN_092337 [Dreissena polymorpha]
MKEKPKDAGSSNNDFYCRDNNQNRQGGYTPNRGNYHGATNVLVDSGSMVTLVSESFYNSLEPKPDLCSMSCFNLDLVGVCGTSLPYLGYIEGDILIPSILEPSIIVPILIVPGIIGTNVLHFCNRDKISEDPYSIALDAMNCTNYVSVKTTNKIPIVIHPNEVSAISRFVRKQKGVKTGLTEATDKPQLSGLTVCTRVVSLECEGVTARVPVRVCNITCKPMRILPNTTICSLSEVKVVDSWKPETVTTPTPVNKTFENLQKLGIKVHKENLTEEQYVRAQQVLENWENIFSKSSTDIGKTDLVKHQIKLNNDTPFTFK